MKGDLGGITGSGDFVDVFIHSETSENHGRILDEVMTACNATP